MIFPGEAQEIVENCIKEVVTNPPDYGAEKPLDAMGVMVDDVLNDFKLQIRDNKKVGVKAFGHTLAASALNDITVESTGGDVETVIIKKAIKSPANKSKKEVKL